MTDRHPLPSGWTWTTLEESSEVILGQSPPSSTYNTDGDGLPFFQGKAEFGTLYPKVEKWCSKPNKIAEKNDILISVRAPVGPTNLAPEKSCIGRGLAAIRPKHRSSHLYFLYWLRYIESDWDSKATGTTFKAISGATLRAHEIPLPPLAEQRRIVEAIETQFTRLDAGVAGLAQVRAKLRRYRAAVLKAACEGRLVPQNPNDEPAADLLARILTERREAWNGRGKYKEPAGISPAAISPPSAETSASPPAGGTEGGRLPQLPVGWVWASLDQLTDLITSGSRGWAKYYSNVGPLFIRAQDINTDALILDEVAHVDLPDGVEGARTRVSHHDLLVTITGANVTKTARVKQDLEEAYVSQHVGLVRPVCGDLATYLHFWVISPFNGRRQLEKYAYGMGKPGLNLTNLRELAVALPPLAEQRRIVAEVDRRLSVVAEVEAAIEANLKRAARLRQSILKKAFAGQLVAQNPTDEPASALLARIKQTRTQTKGNKKR